MIRWMKKHNIGTKILSFIGAVTLWFFIAASSEQDTTRTFGSIPVALSGIDTLLSKGYVILDGGSPLATVSLTGPMRNISVIAADLDVIKAFVDVSNLVPGTNTVKFNAYIDLDDPGLTISERRPLNLSIVVDRVVDMAVPVELVIEGSPASSYRINSTDIWPTMVTLNGPETYLKEIKCARITYNVTGMDDSDSVNIVFELIKENGQPIDENRKSWIKSDVASIELSMEVRRDSTVNLRATFSNMPDYLNEDAIDHYIDPASINVTGDPDTINSLNHIDLGEINIRQIIESGADSVTKIITLPNGVSSPMHGKTATIYVSFPGYERVVHSLMPDVLPELDRVEYVSEQIDITLFGLAGDLALVRDEDITLSPVVDIESLVPGQYTIPLQVTCEADGAAVIGKYTVTINVLEPVEGGEPTGENTDE